MAEYLPDVCNPLGFIPQELQKTKHFKTKRKEKEDGKLGSEREWGEQGP